MLLALVLSLLILPTLATPARADTYFAPAEHYKTGMNPISSVASDLNGDAVLDVAVANIHSDTISVLIGNGDGTMKLAVDYPAGPFPKSITAADFNGDARTDLAVANNGFNTVSVFFNKGDGTYDARITYPTQRIPVHIATADFNADGKADLATSHNNSDDVAILLGNGDGSFQAPAMYSVGDSPVGLMTADFNADGKTDLATTNFHSEDVSILLGNGDGSFKASVNHPLGTQLGEGGIAADFNGDKSVDLAITSRSSGSILVLLGKGDGTFEAPLGYPAGSQQTSVAAADFDADGKTDLAVGNSSIETTSDTVSLLAGNGDGTFGAPIRFEVGDAPYSVNPADFNGDARTDIAVANSSSNTVSVLINADRPVVTKLSLSTSPNLIFYNEKTILTASLKTSSKLLAGKTVTVWRSPDGGASWKQDGTARYDPATRTYKATRALGSNTVFRVRFEGEGVYEPSASKKVSVRVRAHLSRPVTPNQVRKNVSFTTYGYLKPYHSGYTRLYFERFVSGSWRLYKSVDAPNNRYNASTAKYTLQYKLPYPGKWRMRAYHSDASHATTWSPYKYLTVDDLRPTISGMAPGNGSITKDTTPTIKATIKDNVANLSKSNITLYVNGGRVSGTKFSYNRRTDVLTYDSLRLSKGKNTAKIVARDAAGNVGAKAWSFTVVRR